MERLVSSSPQVDELPGGKIIQLRELRQLVAEKFPSATSRLQVSTPEDKTVQFIPRTLTETSGSWGGTSLCIQHSLEETLQFAALIDASNAFEPADVSPSVLPYLLWVRCACLAQAIQAADLLIRDGNLSLIFLDLRGCNARDLQRIPASTWHRFQRLLESSSSALVVCTHRPCIAAARTRILFQSQWAFSDLHSPRKELFTRLQSTRSQRSAAFEELRIA